MVMYINNYTNISVFAGVAKRVHVDHAFCHGCKKKPVKEGLHGYEATSILHVPHLLHNMIMIIKIMDHSHNTSIIQGQKYV